MDGVMYNNTEFINVAIRIKPASEIENHCLRIISKEPPLLFLVDRGQTFSFDNIFTEEASQELIYNETVKPLVQYVKQGYNCTVFAYGQTGTGKTYTMGTDSNVTNEEEYGLIPRTLDHFFQYNNDDKFEIDISVSFIEIYNEKVFDLLQNDNKPPLQVKGLKAQGFSQEKVFNSYEAKHFLNMGNKNRHIAGTKQNLQSSRSHAIFTIYCNIKHKHTETTAKLNLVDLGGCESVKKTGNHGSTLQEGININKGLLSIGQVMTALSNNASYIPYRQSIITSILQDSLNKQNFVLLIACVSSLGEDSTETVQTLEFAQRVKKIKSNPEMNEVISQYKRENAALFQLRMATPFKRPYPSQTPRPTKKHKILTVPESSNTATDHSHSPKSFTSSVASSILNTVRSSTGSDITQQTLSPVIRKYMNAMESSLMDKLGLVIKSTLKRPSRESIPSIEYDKVNGNSKTPYLPWNTIQNEVSKMVRSEIAQLTTNKVRATSSPIEGLNEVRKILNYDDNSVNNVANKENEFKIPNIPTRNKITKCSLALSPIENILPRRSMRISRRYNTKDFDLNDTTRKPNDNFVPPTEIIIRRSMRLSMKQVSGINANMDTESFQFSLNSSNLITEGIRKLHQSKKSHQDSEEYFEDNSRYSVFSWNKSTMDRKQSTSWKIHESVHKKKTKLTISDTPAGKRLLNGQKKDSPCTSHTKEVLLTINTGNAKQLEKLQTVGPKTAQQIVLFRNIKGKIDRLSDLKKMPGWKSKKFDKFVEQNFLKKELI